MKYILAFIFGLFITTANAQTSRNPCFLNGTQSSTGIPSCESVSNTSPLPVVTTPSGAAQSVSINQTTPGTTNGVVAKGGANIATNKITVGTTATQIVAARAGRLAITITHVANAATDAFCGASGVTTTTGDLLIATKGAAKTYSTSGAIFCVVGTGTVDVTFAETY